MVANKTEEMANIADGRKGIHVADPKVWD